jgi:hypothetical protein
MEDLLVLVAAGVGELARSPFISLRPVSDLVKAPSISLLEVE